MMAAPAPNELRRHQQRRGQRIPTVTALVGPAGLCVRAWRDWSAECTRPCAISDAADPLAFLPVWVGAAFAAARPEVRACAWLATATRRKVEEVTAEVSRMTGYDLAVLRRSIPVDPGEPGACAAFLILEGLATVTAPTPARFTHILLDAGEPGHGPARVVRAVLELYPPESLPSLLLFPPDDGREADWAAAHALEQFAAAEPLVPVAVALSANAYDRLTARHAGTRPVALLREGFVEIRGVSGNQLEQRLRAAGVEPPLTAVGRLTADGLAEEVADAFVKATRTVRDPTHADAASDFRSVHEEFLFEQLESMPQTAGLFRPNHLLGFRHGHQSAEGDLVSDSLKIAVEVDGSFYHLNTEQYRRDRRKDWLYQRHGYLVLRFLAEDVVADFETVLNTILEAVALRRASAQPTGVA